MIDIRIATGTAPGAIRSHAVPYIALWPPWINPGTGSIGDAPVAYHYPRAIGAYRRAFNAVRVSASSPTPGDATAINKGDDGGSRKRYARRRYILHGKGMLPEQVYPCAHIGRIARIVQRIMLFAINEPVIVGMGKE